MSIHPTAIIDPKTEIADGVEIGPYSVIGQDVSIGENTWIGSHVVINGRTRIGQKTRIYQFASIGEALQEKHGRNEGVKAQIGETSQEKKDINEEARAVVGDKDAMREGVAIHHDTERGNAATQIGDDNVSTSNSHTPTPTPTGEIKLDNGVEIGSYSVIEQDVSIGENTWVGSHVVINKRTSIGRENHIYQFASIGEASQDKKYKDEDTRTEIGDKNVIRECVTVHRGTVQDNGVTKIGNDNLLMANSHIAHDCTIGNHNIFANSSALAGHVMLGDYIVFSAFCGVHQFCKVGSHAFIAHASTVLKDVPPYVMITGGHSPTVCGINTEGLRRCGFSAEDIKILRRAYKVLYRQGLSLTEAIEKLREMERDSSAVKILADFLQQSTRSIIR